MPNLPPILANTDAVRAAAALAQRGGHGCVRGAIGSSTTAVIAAMRVSLDQPILLITAHLDDADESCEELESWDVDVARFPAMELIPGESSVNLELLAERLTLLRRLADGHTPTVIVAPIHALMQSTPDAADLPSLLRRVVVGDAPGFDGFVRWLDSVGYTRVEAIDSPGEFSVRGGIIDVFHPGDMPIRLDFFGDEVESIREIDLDTMGSDRRVEHADIVSVAAESSSSAPAEGSLIEYLSERGITVIAEMIEVNEQARSYLERAADGGELRPVAEVIRQLDERCHALIEVNQFSGAAASDRMVSIPVGQLPTFAENASESVAELGQLAESMGTIVFCQNEGEQQRLRELLDEFAPQAPVEVHLGYLHRGFTWSDDDVVLAVVPYHELLHRYQVRRRVRRIASRTLDAFVDLEPGDFVVHRDHGIAEFVGLRSLQDKNEATPTEFLTLEFAGKSRLHIPAAKIDLIQKYIGAFHGRPELSRLGGKKWGRQKEKVQDAVKDLASAMLRLQAARAARPGIRYPADTTWQSEFEAEFPYEETEDQLAAIAEVKRDMAGPRPMDRLVCGDVGFGKTEVAIRAAFKAAEFGKQTAVLVPTTVLAEQHERTFGQRFADYPFRIESLSRFKTGKQQKELLKALGKGQIDVMIGTHRLLSKDVHFADLGLVIVDEEQRFGVDHKQRLLELRMNADVLTLSATPIPRTLHMALLGLRDISSLTTAPLDRRAIVTEVINYDRHRIQLALQRELAREGQVFYVHNRVHNIQSVADDVRQLVPEARVIVGHGQMPARQLESVMLKFMRHEVDILVCTTIIESGIDIPTANTMFVHDANMFGLSELHQLRGRVGRYKHRAYCYLVLPNDRVITEVAVKRLRAIEQFSMLGAGFKIALRDLEIRGAGNLLGAQQSGHIAAVGYEMYCQLLEQAVAELKEEKRTGSIDIVVDLGMGGSLPKGYIPSDGRRMDAYRRISRANSIDELQQAEDDLISAYGPLPQVAERLVRIAELRIRAAGANIGSITRHEGDLIFATTMPGALIERLDGVQGSLRLVGQPDVHGVTQLYYRPPPAYLESDSILTVLLHRLRTAMAPADTAAVE